VTSALHMLRAERVFREQFPNDTIVPIPVNYIYSHRRPELKDFVPSTYALSMSNDVLHELLGLLWYYLRYQ